MQKLIDILEATLRQTTFSTWNNQPCTPNELRNKYRTSPYLSNPSVTTATPQVPENLFAELSLFVRKLLGKFIVDDRIGSGVANLMSYDKDVSVDEFTLSLVRGASVVGPEATAQLLCSWMNSEPLRYRIQFVLWGAHFPGAFALDENIAVMEIPNDRIAIQEHLPFPDSVMWRHRDIDFLNKAKVSIECEATPALWSPMGKEAPLKGTWTARKLSGWPVEQFCQALSISCDQFVSWKLWWCDFGDLIMFNSGRSSVTELPAHSYDSMITEFSTAQLTQSHFEDTFDILTKLQASKGKLDVATGRWNRSKRPDAALSDKFIELRVALESLYLSDIDRDRGELSFRLATRGAWHLGANFKERQRYYKTLRNAYGTASAAVHQGKVNSTDKNHQLLADAQDLCRLGILKRLEEGTAPNWNALILGKELDAVPMNDDEARH